VVVLVVVRVTHGKRSRVHACGSRTRRVIRRSPPPRRRRCCCCATTTTTTTTAAAAAASAPPPTSAIVIKGGSSSGGSSSSSSVVVVSVDERGGGRRHDEPPQPLHETLHLLLRSEEEGEGDDAQSFGVDADEVLARRARGVDHAADGHDGHRLWWCCVCVCVLYEEEGVRMRERQQ